MILVIPALDLAQGRCLRCVQGEPGMEEVYNTYSESPAKLVQLWRRENAKSIQVADRDALEGRDNTQNRTSILNLVQSIDIPITLLSRFDDVETCRFWLENDVYRIVISKLACTDPEGVRALIAEYTPSRIVFGILARKGKISYTDGQQESDIDFARSVRALGGTRLVYTDIRWEGTLAGPDLPALRRIAEQSGMRVTAAGGVANVQQLWQVQELESCGVDSVVIGRALYENRFPCQKIWRLAEAELDCSSTGRS